MGAILVTLAAVSAEKSIARLPRGARPPVRVFVNGVEQREPDDYVLEGDRLVFNRSLSQEGKLGVWRWALIFFGIAGTYRKHENVDVQYTLDGRPKLATGLPVEPLGSRRPG
jgi:hypothetical protein